MKNLEKVLAVLLLLCAECQGAPDRPREVVESFYKVLPKRGPLFRHTDKELQDSPCLNSDFKRELLADRKGLYKKDGGWLIDFDLLTCIQEGQITAVKVGKETESGQAALVSVEVNYIGVVRPSPLKENITVHLSKGGSTWLIDNVIYDPKLKLGQPDAVSFLKWAKKLSGH